MYNEGYDLGSWRVLAETLFNTQAISLPQICLTERCLNKDENITEGWRFFGCGSESLLTPNQRVSFIDIERIPSKFHPLL